MALSNQELVRLKYPVRPDPQKAPGAYASWLKAVSKPATFIPPKTVNVEGRPQGLAQNAGANTQYARLANSDTTTQQFYAYSAYASGYILDQATSPFDWIQGEWNVPAIVGGEEGTWTFSDFWIGLSPSSGENVSVPSVFVDGYVEVGTRAQAININGFTYATYYPWTLSSQRFRVISNFVVNPGDDIYGEVWVTDAGGNFNPYGGYSNFYFWDLTTGQSTYLVEPITPGTFPGQSAVWLMSRIAPGDGTFSDLADYSFAVMRQPLARTGDGNFANYQGGVGVGRSAQVLMFAGNDISSFHLLSAVYPIDSNTMEFIWSNYH
jgi:Peptidase A4 family